MVRVNNYTESSKLEILRESRHFLTICNTSVCHLILLKEGNGKDSEPGVRILLGSATTNQF